MEFWTSVGSWAKANPCLAATLFVTWIILTLWSFHIEHKRQEQRERERAELHLEATRCLQKIMEYQRYLDDKRSEEQHHEQTRQTTVSYVANTAAKHRLPAWDQQRLNNLLLDYEHVKSEIAAQDDKDPDWRLGQLGPPTVWDINRPEVEVMVAAVLKEQRLQVMEGKRKWSTILDTSE